jgi:uncharacterized surface protein with fasciclin (FAS1) repeats
VGGLLLVGILLVGLVGCTDEPRSAPSAADSTALGPVVDSMTVTRVLRTDRRFSTLVAALDSTGLDSTLSTDGPYTLFAPPDTAFAALPTGTMPLLMTEDRDRLRRILGYHAVAGHVGRAALRDSTTLTTLSGDTLRVRPTDSTARIGTANVVDGDIEVANGRIHVIDRVLRPPATAADATP